MALFASQSKKQTLDDTRTRDSVTPLRLVIHITDGSQQPRVFSVPLQNKLLIGRGGGSGEQQPDVDLSTFRALENGVSRWHAQLTHDGDFLSIEDLDSTNGTRINGYQLSAHRPYRLRDGDEIEIGRIRLMVSLVHIPNQA